MARADPQVNFRIPEALKSALEQAATAAGRSLTAEIVQRLESSFTATTSEELEHLQRVAMGTIETQRAQMEAAEMQNDLLALLLLELAPTDARVSARKRELVKGYADSLLSQRAIKPGMEADLLAKARVRREAISAKLDQLRVDTDQLRTKFDSTDPSQRSATSDRKLKKKGRPVSSE